MEINYPLKPAHLARTPSPPDIDFDFEKMAFRFLSRNSSISTPLLTGYGRCLSSTTVEAFPAPGTPFHLAFPVHNLDVAKHFYGEILGCQYGRSSTKWQDFSLGGHQIVCHWVGEDYRCPDFYNPVDGDEVIT